MNRIRGRNLLVIFLDSLRFTFFQQFPLNEWSPVATNIFFQKHDFYIALYKNTKYRKWNYKKHCIFHAFFWKKYTSEKCEEFFSQKLVFLGVLVYFSTLNSRSNDTKHMQLRLKIQKILYWTLLLHVHFNFCQDGIGVSLLPSKVEPVEKSYQVLFQLK